MDGIYTLISKLTNIISTNDNNKSEVLDPIIVLVRLSMLKYKPMGTKLSFNNNSISFDEPGILQGINRYVNKDSRTSVHNIYNPLQKVTIWYDYNDEKIKYLLENAKRGLTNLIESYSNTQKSNIILHSLNYYIDTIDTIINNNINEEELNATIDVYAGKLKDIWSNNQLIIIYSLLQEIDKLYNEKKISELTSYIKSLESILEYKELLVQNIVSKVSTSL